MRWSTPSMMTDRLGLAWATEGILCRIYHAMMTVNPQATLTATLIDTHSQTGTFLTQHCGRYVFGLNSDSASSSLHSVERARPVCSCGCELRHLKGPWPRDHSNSDRGPTVLVARLVHGGSALGLQVQEGTSRFRRSRSGPHDRRLGAKAARARRDSRHRQPALVSARGAGGAAAPPGSCPASRAQGALAPPHAGWRERPSSKRACPPGLPASARPGRRPCRRLGLGRRHPEPRAGPAPAWSCDSCPAPVGARPWLPGRRMPVT